MTRHEIQKSIANAVAYTLTNDGGPAFPRSSVGSADTGQIDSGAEGMSLRDWFAGNAREADVQRWLSILVLNRDYNGYDGPCDEEAAKYAYADAMLKVREASDG